MRYFVVDIGRIKNHRYRCLLPLYPTRVDNDGHALRVDVEGDDLSARAEFDPSLFHSFSDEDLPAATLAT